MLVQLEPWKRCGRSGGDHLMGVTEFSRLCVVLAGLKAEIATADATDVSVCLTGKPIGIVIRGMSQCRCLHGTPRRDDLPITGALPIEEPGDGVASVGQLGGSTGGHGHAEGNGHEADSVRVHPGVVSQMIHRRDHIVLVFGTPKIFGTPTPTASGGIEMQHHTAGAGHFIGSDRGKIPIENGSR